MAKNNITRCSWVSDDPLYVAYHDNEWGVPVHDDAVLFEFLILEGAQAGLSWLTVLKRREGYKNAFRDFDVEKIAKFNEADVGLLMQDSGIIRNKLKINSAIRNAKVFIAIQAEFGSFDRYLWQFVSGEPVVNRINEREEPIVTSDVSDVISKDLKKRGMNFVGSTIIYAYMQAVGLVNDHTQNCYKSV